MSYRRPQNPVRIRPDKFRSFDGVGGPAIQVLQRFNERGWDISNTVCNEAADLNLHQSGSMILRDGSRKITSSGLGATVTNLFQVTVGNVLAYGVVVNGALSVITMPRMNVRDRPFVMSPYEAIDATSRERASESPEVWYP